MAFRADSSKLSKGERTPQGFLRLDARFTRTGILEYKLPDGSISRELRRPEEVSATASLASLDGVPLTVWHRAKRVDSKNAKSVRVGGVMHGTVRLDGDFVAGGAQIDDAATIDAIDKGELAELSCGYECLEDRTPGVWNGQPYDLEQKQITYNHVALLPKGAGRAGAAVALRLDSLDELPEEQVLTTHFDAQDSAPQNPEVTIISPPQEKRMLIGKIELKIDAKDEAVIAAHIAELDAKNAKLEAEAAAGAKARAELQTKLDAAVSPAAVQAAVAARVALETVARKHLGADADVATKTDSQLRSEVVAKALPALKCDGKDEATIRAYFDVAAAIAPEVKEIATPDANVEKLRRAAAGTRTDATDVNDPDAARAAMVQANREIGLKPLSA